MIVAGCLGLGLWYRSQFILRLAVLRKLMEILEMLMSEIRYGKATLPECCKRVGERQKEPFQGSLLRIYEIMCRNTGESFPDVFCGEMEDCLRTLPITEEDRTSFLLFARGESFGDDCMQLRTIERSRELLLLTIDKLEKENTQKCRMAVGLGAMSGLLVIIILI